MRSLEIALLFANLPLLAWCLWRRPRSAWPRMLATIALMVLALQVAVEGARWPLGPAYLLTISLFLWCWWPRRSAPGRWTAIAGIGLLVAAAAMATVLPVFDLPMPTGRHLIGTVTLHLVDPARKETQSDQREAQRELMVQIWYPADQSGPGQAYRTWAETEFKKRHLALVRTHAAAGVPVAGSQGRYPVVLFSPSWTGSWQVTDSWWSASIIPTAAI
jgi:hypothetical protein